ncbi:MAG: hypothetical protein OXU45_06215 [Candidatus Melainabacteria bacterium]|nr:hypothetical protein [Candidatus Melainabacteria bacterium]
MNSFNIANKNSLGSAVSAGLSQVLNPLLEKIQPGEELKTAAKPLVAWLGRAVSLLCSEDRQDLLAAIATNPDDRLYQIVDTDGGPKLQTSLFRVGGSGAEHLGYHSLNSLVTNSQNRRNLDSLKHALWNHLIFKPAAGDYAQTQLQFTEKTEPHRANLLNVLLTKSAASNDSYSLDSIKENFGDVLHANMGAVAKNITERLFDDEGRIDKSALLAYNKLLELYEVRF